MTVPHHLHNFEIPAATREDIVAGVSVDRVVVPATLGSASVEDSSAFATAEQGRKADRSVPPERTIMAGTGLKGGGALSSDISLELDPLTLQLITAVETAVQKTEVGTLAYKNRISPGDIQATGTANSSTVLYGDGVWRVPGGSSGSSSGSGDMLAAVYDPRHKSADVFDMDNMTDGLVNKVITVSDKNKLTALPADAVSAQRKILTGFGLSGGGSLGNDIAIKISDDVAVSIDRGRTALQGTDVGALAFRNQVSVSDIAAAQVPGATTFLRGDGVWAEPEGKSETSVFPVGMISAFAAKNCPDGWLICDGASLLRTQYAALFDAIGTVYDLEDNGRTFRVPDLRGEFIRGWDGGRGVDSGRYFGQWQADSIQNVKGRLSTRNSKDDFDAFTTASGAFRLEREGHLSRRAASQSENVYNANSVMYFDLSFSARTSQETRPRNIALLYCIKY